MTEQEINWFKSEIDGIKADFKEDVVELKGGMKTINDIICDFIKNHIKTCFFLIWKKNRWHIIGKVLAVAGVVIASPAFVLGIIEIVQTVIK